MVEDKFIIDSLCLKLTYLADDFESYIKGTRHIENGEITDAFFKANINSARTLLKIIKETRNENSIGSGGDNEYLNGVGKD